MSQDGHSFMNWSLGFFFFIVADCDFAKVSHLHLVFEILFAYLVDHVWRKEMCAHAF